MSEDKRVLVYCGTNHGDGFIQEINSGDWTHIYGFEANPVLFEKVYNMVKSDPRIKMYNTIVSDTHNEETEFYILDANGTGREYSSSIVNVDDWSPELDELFGTTSTQK